MEKIYELLKKLGIELTADQKKQLGEVAEKEFVAAADFAAQKTKLAELTKQLADRDKDLEKLKGSAASEDVKRQLADLTAKYDADTKALNEKLAAQEQSFAAEKLLSGYKFASERVKNSVLEEFKAKGFKYENGAFVGGKEYLEELKKNEPDVFAKEAPGLLMGSTQSNVPADANNTAAQISAAFGLKNNIGGK